MPKAKKTKDLSQKVMNQIHREQVKMRPRLFFIAGSLFLGSGLAGAVVLATLFINLAFFRMRVHEPFGYLWFGHFGLGPFLTIFPWLPFLIAVFGIMGGLALIRHYDISYKKSFLGLGIGLVALVLTTGFLLDQIGLNERVERLAPLRPLYQGQFRGQDWVVGEITRIEGERIEIVNPEGEAVTILKNEKTLLPFGGDFQEGERIRAIGQWQDDSSTGAGKAVFVAKGIGRGGLQWRATPGQGREMPFNGPPRQF